ncbi:MAG: methyltransferase domain-containing protein [Chlamydiota bacterium]
MKSIGEALLLPLIRLKLLWFNIIEELTVHRYFYKNSLFKQVDVSLKHLYFGQNPYIICKDFMQSCKQNQVHVYGETPLTEIYSLLMQAGLQKEDCFIDLGCGRGRNVFFASTLFGCKTIGIDIVPIFCDKAQKLASSLPNPPKFLCEDMSTADLSEGTILYFYALCLEEDLFLSMITKLASLKVGTKIITVSFPLSDYSKKFSTLFSKQVSYPWGKTELFINTKIT